MTTASQKSALTPRMEAVLARLCKVLGSISKTQAVKLPYLVDVIAKNELGHTVANAKYQCWQFGVVASEIYHAIEHSPAFCVKERSYSEGSKWVELVASTHVLSPEEQQIVDRVAVRFGKMDQDTLGLLTKRMNTHIPTNKWGSNATAALGHDAYHRISEQWQQMCQRLNKVDYSKLDDGAVDVSDDEELLRLVS